LEYNKLKESQENRIQNNLKEKKTTSEQIIELEK